MLRFDKSDTAQHWATRPAGSPLAGIELGRRRSREVRRLEQFVGSAVVLARLRPALWSRNPTPDAITGDKTEPPDPNSRRTRKYVLLPAAPTAGTLTPSSRARAWPAGGKVPGQRPMASGPRKVRAIPRNANEPAVQPHDRGQPRTLLCSIIASPSPLVPLGMRQRAPRFPQAPRPFGSAMTGALRSSVHRRHRAAAGGAVRRDGGGVPARLLEVPLLRWHTVAPPVLSVVSRMYPDRFRYHANWKAGQVHPPICCCRRRSIMCSRVVAAALGASARTSSPLHACCAARGGEQRISVQERYRMPH